MTSELLEAAGRVPLALRDSYRAYRGRAMTLEEERAAMDLTPLSAPLGLTEWRTTTGDVYAKGANAVDVQVGINRRAAAAMAPEKEGA